MSSEEAGQTEPPSPATKDRWALFLYHLVNALSLLVLILLLIEILSPKRIAVADVGAAHDQARLGLVLPGHDDGGFDRFLVVPVHVLDLPAAGGEAGGHVFGEAEVQGLYVPYARFIEGVDHVLHANWHYRRRGIAVGVYE